MILGLCLINKYVPRKGILQGQKVGKESEESEDTVSQIL